MLQLLIRRRARDKEAVAVANGQSTDKASAGNAAVHHWDDIAQLGIEGAVEVCAAANGDEAVGIGEAAEDADL